MMMDKGEMEVHLEEGMRGMGDSMTENKAETEDHLGTMIRIMDKEETEVPSARKTRMEALMKVGMEGMEVLSEETMKETMVAREVKGAPFGGNNDKNGGFN